MQMLIVIFAYVLGSIPFGLFIAGAFCGVDPRTQGSGNVGATNVGRSCGTVYGVLTLAMDLLKGLIPVVAAVQVSDSTYFISCTAFAALFGHCCSLFLDFKGGKGVATSIGIFIPLAFWPLLLSVLTLVTVLKTTGYMSLGSLCLVASLPVFLLFSGHFGLIPLALVTMVVVFWRHRENIIRLAQGEEHHWRG